MYKRFAAFLVICNFILIACTLNVFGLRINRVVAMEAFQSQMSSGIIEKDDFLGLVAEVASGQRIIDVQMMTKELKYDLCEEDYENLLKIVEAEAGGEDFTGKMLVANVVLNRVESQSFPDTVTEVIFQQENGVSQFSPISDGRFESVIVSDETVEAVEEVLYGEDSSQGALYFAARTSASADRMAWFDSHLTKLFTYGHHEFFS